jgi:membrane-associated HD superfamily phosphohydrolase
MRNLLLSFILILSACSIAQPLDNTVTTAERLIQYYDSDITQLVLTADLSEQEVRAVQNALRTADRIRNSFEQYKNNETALNVRLLEIEYSRLKNAYLSVRSIALNHQLEYDQYTWDTFEIFDIFASELDVRFNELISSARTNEAIINTISLANSIIRIAALL